MVVLVPTSMIDSEFGILEGGFAFAVDVMRSSLLMPINNPRFLEAAWTRNCDGIDLDLEDTLGEPYKEYVRRLPQEVYSEVSKGGATISVRINHMYWEADLEASVWPGLDTIMYPKTESPEDIRDLDGKISELERQRGMRPGTVKIKPLIDTMRGVVKAYEIASSSTRIKGFSGGGLAYDGSRDIGVEHVSGVQRDPYGVGQCFLAASVLGLQWEGGVFAQPSSGSAIDTEDASLHAIANRMAGRYIRGGCIHPDQVEPMNRGYTPTREEVEESKQVVDLFEELDTQGSVETGLNGRVVDKWEVNRARKLIDWASACDRKEREKAEARERAEAEEGIAGSSFLKG